MTKMSISAKLAIRTGAERENLLLSATSTTRRACSMMAREISTSRTSKSSSVPSESIAEVPMMAISTRNFSICATVARADNAAVALPDRAAGHDHLRLLRCGRVRWQRAGCW